MSELGYGSPKEIPSVFQNQGNSRIVSYLIGSFVDHRKTKSFLYDFISRFNYSPKNFLVAFTDENIVIGELNKGNNADDSISISYDEIKSFIYYNKSGDLEIITDTNSKYVIKVSKHELNDSLKNLDRHLELKYLDKNFN